MVDKSTREAFIDRWLERPEEERAVGLAKRCSYWAWYGINRRNFHKGEWMFSFMRLQHRGERLFVSAAEILEMSEYGNEDRYAKERLLEEKTSLFGHLVINLYMGNKFTPYVFNLGNFRDEATVEESLSALYNGETFQGYDHVRLPFAKLDQLFRREIMSSYHNALESVTGVYCLMDTRTGKLYIGPETGGGAVSRRVGATTTWTPSTGETRSCTTSMSVRVRNTSANISASRFGDTSA